MSDPDEPTTRERRPECDTVKCHEYPTAFIRFRRKWRSVSGEMKETVTRGRYCDDHTEMWEQLDRPDRTVEVIAPEEATN